MAKKTTPKIDTGIAPQQRRAIADSLSRLLADEYTLYLKTHNFHWNVTGPMFNTLHLMFEQHYNESALAVDLIAERIRALGHPAPGSYAAVRRTLVDPGAARRAEGDGDGATAREGPRGLREDGARGVPHR